MGGREGGRGYLYQSIATLLGSLRDKEWKFVQVEADSDNDKIDILWEYPENKIKVVQVKSSQNNISKGQIINWLIELTTDVPTADQFQLFLIGNVNDSTSKFISKINRSTTIDEDDDDYDQLKEIIHFISKVKVDLENFQLESLETKINWNLNVLLTNMGHMVNAHVIDQIAGGLIYQFTKFSTHGKKISREKYTNIFEEWIYYNYPQVKGNGLIKKVLTVEFYLKDMVDFSDHINAIKANSSYWLSTYKKELFELISKINAIKLPTYKKSTHNKDSTPLFKGLLTSGGLNYKHSELSNENKDKIITKTKELIGIDISREFFYVGELMEPTVVFNQPFMSPPSDIGSETEKEKGSLIDSFLVKLIEYEETLKYSGYIDSFFILPLILRNTGSVSDEEIEVNIKLPKNIEIISKTNLKYPTPFVITDFTGGHGLLEKSLKHQRNYKIEEYIGSKIPFFEDRLLQRFESEEEKERRMQRKFEHYIDTLFDYEIFMDSEYNVLQFFFGTLNSRKNLAFPSFILVKASESFTIEYEITSKNLGDQLKGSSYYKI